MSSPRQDLAQIIAKRGDGDQSGLAREIAAYLLDTNKVYELESVLRDVQAMREADGHFEAEVYVAHDITPEILDEVDEIIKKSKPGAKTITAQQVIDPDVIGGLKVRLANEQLDMTVRNKLDTFKRLTAEGAN